MVEKTDPYGTYLPKRINQYVPGMKYASDVGPHGVYQVNFGTPPLAESNVIIAAASADTGGATTLAGSFATGNGSNAKGEILGCPWGRTISFFGSTAAATGAVAIIGRDYLGQPTTFEGDLNGTTTVDSGRAFQWIDSVSIQGVINTTGNTFTVGTGIHLGLPYKTIAVLTEEASGVPANANMAVFSSGLTAPVLTDPMTASSGDPRGTYNPFTTLDGSVGVTATFIASNATIVDASGNNNGGLHGIKQNTDRA